jgi:hypothetical protein
MVSPASGIQTVYVPNSEWRGPRIGWAYVPPVNGGRMAAHFTASVRSIVKAIQSRAQSTLPPELVPPSVHAYEALMAYRRAVEAKTDAIVDLMESFSERV